MLWPLMGTTVRGRLHLGHIAAPLAPLPPPACLGSSGLDFGVSGFELNPHSPLEPSQLLRS